MRNKRNDGNIPDVSKPLHVQFALHISLTLFIVGLLLIGASAVSFFSGSELIPKAWCYYCVAIGIILLVIGIGWGLKFFSMAVRFRRWISTKSKSEFISNLDEIEYLAWRLPKKYEADLKNKKREFNLK
ncbi:MAG: DUF3198 domain-containing protein [Methanomassiliicoccales archaeon]